jgi:hypothetical protein
MKNKIPKKEQMKRMHRQSFMLNELEMKAINRYCKKYKVSNRSRFMRETIFTAILKKFEDDHPTLFEVDEKPDLFTSS